MLHHLNGELYLATHSRIPIVCAEIIQFKIIHAQLPFMEVLAHVNLAFIVTKYLSVQHFMINSLSLTEAEVLH